MQSMVLSSPKRLVKLSESELTSLRMDIESLMSSLGVPDLMAESMEVIKLEKPFFMDRRPELISFVRLGTVSTPVLVRTVELFKLFEAEELIDCDCMEMPVSGLDP